MSSLHIYTFVVSRAFMAGAASQAGDADSTRAPGLTSGLQGSVNVHRGALLLVPQWQCISYFVFYIFTFSEIKKTPEWVTHGQKIFVALEGMYNTRPVKHSDIWQPRKCDFWTDARQNDPYVLLCFTDNTTNAKQGQLSNNSPLLTFTIFHMQAAWVQKVLYFLDL